MRTCLHCGIDLDSIGKNKKAIYCSKQCKQKVFTQKNYESILEKNRNWYQENKEKRLETCSQYYQSLSKEQREQKLEISRLSYHKNKFNGKALTRSAKRRCAKLNRTPKWLSEFDLFFIEEMYHLATLRSQTLKTPFEVDHIIPLQGKTVSGLHVPTNLQIISRYENRSKKNLVGKT